MKNSNFAILVILLSLVITAKSQTSIEKRPLLIGDGLYTFRYENILGTPFLKDEWTPADIKMNNQKVYNNALVKFDLSQNNFILNIDDQAYFLSKDVSEVCMKADTVDTSKKIIYRRGYQINKSINSSNFVQLLNEGGKVSLLKFTKKIMQEYSEYNDATKYKRFNLIEQYFILKDSKFTQIVLSKKYMAIVFADKWQQIDSWLIQNNFSGKDEKSWIAAVSYYN